MQSLPLGLSSDWFKLELTPTRSGVLGLPVGVDLGLGDTVLGWGSRPLVFVARYPASRPRGR